MTETLTLSVLRTLRNERRPVLVPDVAARLGWSADADLHPIRQVLNHLSRDGDGVERVSRFGSFRYYAAAADIDDAIAKREG